MSFKRLGFIPVLMWMAASTPLVTSCDDDDDNENNNGENSVALDTAAESLKQGVSVSGMVGNYTYVDLGLESGIKWATYNVGSTKPAEYGIYYAWGETSPKDSYTLDNYKWKSDTVKYANYSLVNTLEAADDAATANWGDAWRMPTAEELMELFEGCEWSTTRDFNGSGIAGRVGTSKTNGKTIFLPAAGYQMDGNSTCISDFGSYWSSTSDLNGAEGIPMIAQCSSFSVPIEKTGAMIDLIVIQRFSGQSVRAVVK